MMRHRDFLRPAFPALLTRWLLCVLFSLSSAYVWAEAGQDSTVKVQGVGADDFSRLAEERKRRVEAAQEDDQKAGENEQKDGNRADKKDDPKKAESIKNDPKKPQKNIGRNSAASQAQEASNRAMLWLLSAAGTITLAVSAGLIWALGPKRVCPKCNEKDRHWIKISAIQPRGIKWRKRYKYHCFSCGYRWRDQRG